MQNEPIYDRQNTADSLDLSNEGPYTLDEESLRISALASRIGGYTQLDKLLLKSNCSNIKEACAVINGTKNVPQSASAFGTLVPEGSIGFVEKNGVMYACEPGRYRLYNPRASWESVQSFANLPIQAGPINIFRVPVGHYGMVFVGNDPFLVSSENGGLFAVNNPAFRFMGSIKIGETYIKHSTIHIIRVPKGSYGCVKQNNVPALLPPGVHVFKTDDFVLTKFASLSEESVTFETITRFFVPKGNIGMAWRDSQPVFFQERGVYLVDSPMFRYVGSVPIETPEIILGSRKIITVKEGMVGVSHHKGQLKILPPGRHVIEDEEHVFDEFLSTQQKSLNLTKDSNPSQLLMVCESRELVRIGIQASVFYNIRDPKLAVVKIGDVKDIENFINDTATAVITTIIRTTSLAEIAQSGRAMEKGAGMMGDDGDQAQSMMAAAQHDRNSSTRKAGNGGDEHEQGGGDDFETNLPFFDRMHTDFIFRLRENFLNEYGIFMLNVRIGDFKVLDEDIAQSIANHASTTAATQAKLANLEGNRQIDLVNKDSDFRIERMQADVDAHRMTTNARARALAMKEDAQAQAEALKIAAAAKMEATKLEAEAEAGSIRVIAQAEAEATRAKGDAESERASKLGSIAFGREVTLAEIHASMVEKSMGGVEKVVYLPTEMQKNPFALFSPNSLAGEK